LRAGSARGAPSTVYFKTLAEMILALEEMQVLAERISGTESAQGRQGLL
jgi:hypothetical protein